jgi:hypothetical protein
MKCDCSTCEFAGHDGDYGTIPTCDAPSGLSGAVVHDATQAAIDRWVQGGEVGPCPHHKPAWWTDPEELAAFEASLLATDEAIARELALVPTSPRHGALGSLSILALLRLRSSNVYLWGAYVAQLGRESLAGGGR